MPRVMTATNELNVPLGITDIDAHGSVPAVGHQSKVRIGTRSKLSNDIGKWITEIFVFPASKAMTSHYDAASKKSVIRIQASDHLALIFIEKVPRD